MSEAVPSSKALWGAKPVRRYPQSSPCCCHTQGCGEARSGFGKRLCSSGTAANATVGGYLQPGSPSRVMMIILAARLLLQAALVLGHLPECCSSSGEGRSRKASCSPTFPGWAPQPDKEKLNFSSLTSGSDSFPHTEFIADQWFLSADINTNITAGQLVIEAVYYSSTPQ